MPFSFGAVCDLLQSLESNCKRKKRRKTTVQIVNGWFDRHGEKLAQDVDNVALLSTLLPERRTDRVFNIKHKRLEHIVARACLLGSSRKERLRRWETQPGSGNDLPECVEAILAEAPNGGEKDFTVEEIDSILHHLAAEVPFSSAAVRSSLRPGSSTSTPRGDVHPLEDLFRRMTPRDAKWLCRLVLKCFLPVVVPEHLVYLRCHPLLPTVMKIHDNFAVAVALLEQPRQNSRGLGLDLHKDHLPRLIKPQVGVKVGRQTWLKARSIQHCLDMGRGLMSCETKMDGEYCQVHIDLSKGPDCIQIFSKSGKDSTSDRINLHGAIQSSLGLGTPWCKFNKRCILEGELVVWSDRDNKVLGFEKIRKHVNRSGRFIGTDKDSQAHSYERLMIVYFDVLLVDDDSMLDVRHSERRRRLTTLVSCLEGCASLVQSQIINFSSRAVAATELQEAFASCIMNREEGLVLKPDEPYFNFGEVKRKYASCCLKLKKGYINKLGDVGDFAVVGARYDPTRAKTIGLPNTKYTHFYLGCLKNKEAAIRFGSKPEFTVVNEVELNAQMTEFFKRAVWAMPVSPEENDQFALEQPTGIMQGKKITTIFLERPVFDITCFSFHKEANTGFWSLRFPYVSKIHSDRSWKDCVSFNELQELAEADKSRDDEEGSQELVQWIKALEETAPKRTRTAVIVESQSTDATQTSGSAEKSASQCSIIESPITRMATHAWLAASASTGILTPPTSSAVQTPGQATTENDGSIAPSRKRRRERLPISPRRVKQRKEVIDLTASPVTSDPSPNGVRQPLEDITSAPSSQVNVPPPHLARVETFHEEPKSARSSPLPPRLLGSGSNHTVALSSPLKARNSTALSSTDRRSNATRDQTCRHAGRTCALAEHFVLLSPCVAKMPWLVEDLLPSHGVAAVFTDVPSWLASAALQMSSSRRQPRLVLVERRRSGATSDFLTKLEAEPLRGRNGQPVACIAYDWRLLEAITDEEKVQLKSDGSGTRQRNGTGAHAKELWKRYYVGLC